MILTENVSKYYGSFCAVDDVSFEMKKGEIVGFLGQNGAGKTTLMRILTAFMLPTKGRVVIAGYELKGSCLEARRKIGYLPENPPLYNDMKVTEYLRFGAQLKDVARNQQQMQVDRVIELCSLEKVRTKSIGTLSKGYRQRVGIAQAIIHEPEILILDEPMSGLDPIQIEQVRKVIKNLNSERTVIISTHILSEMEKLANRILMIKNGKIIADKPLNTLLAYGKETRLHLCVKGDRLVIDEAIKETNGIKIEKFERLGDVCGIDLIVTQKVENYEELLVNIRNSGAYLIELKEMRKSLEQAFICEHMKERAEG